MLNKVQIIGRIVKDLELRKTSNGTSVLNMTVVTSEKFKDKSGQQKETSEFHNVVVYNVLAENIAKYKTKGELIYIEGKLGTRSWEDNGQKRYKTEITAFSAVFFPGNSSGEGKSKSSESQQDDIPSYDDMDDLPF